MQTAMQKIGDSYLLVTPDGKPLPHKDAEEPTFHILPELYNPYCDIDLSDISLVLAEIVYQGSTERMSVLPDQVEVRQPYPNEDYYIAGTPQRKMGWDIPLDLNTPPKWLDLEWQVQMPLQIEERIRTISHRFILEFTSSQQGHVFSMDQANRFYDENARPLSYVSLDDVDDRFIKKDPSFKSYFTDYPPGLAFFQTLRLNACAWSDLGLDEFEDMVHLRDLSPSKTFTHYLDEFASDACIEIPPEVFKESILKAKSVTEEQEAIWHEQQQFELCPGLQHLCQWWNTNAPNPEYRRAAFVYVWVRVEDESKEYWSGWNEIPGMPIGAMTASMCARVSQHVVIEFLQGRLAYTPVGKNGFEFYGVNGEIYCDVGSPIEEADEAYYGHEMLKGFPRRFPVAFQSINSSDLLVAPSVPLLKNSHLYQLLYSPDRFLAWLYKQDDFTPCLHPLHQWILDELDCMKVGDSWHLEAEACIVAAVNHQNSCERLFAFTPPWFRKTYKNLKTFKVDKIDKYAAITCFEEALGRKSSKPHL